MVQRDEKWVRENLPGHDTQQGLDGVQAAAVSSAPGVAASAKTTTSSPPPAHGRSDHIPWGTPVMMHGGPPRGMGPPQPGFGPPWGMHAHHRGRGMHHHHHHRPHFGGDGSSQEHRHHHHHHHSPGGPWEAPPSFPPPGMRMMMGRGPWARGPWAGGPHHRGGCGGRGGGGNRQGRLMARFVRATPEQSVVAPGGDFVQTWEVRNESQFSWPNHVELVFVGGDAELLPEDPDPAIVPGALAPSEVRDISLVLRAPATPGRYEAIFRLRERVPGTSVDAATSFTSGHKFGQRLWCVADVVATDAQGNATSTSGTDSASVTSSGSDTSDYKPGTAMTQRDVARQARLTRLQAKARFLRAKLARVEAKIANLDASAGKTRP